MTDDPPPPADLRPAPRPAAEPPRRDPVADPYPRRVTVAAAVIGVVAALTVGGLLWREYNHVVSSVQDRADVLAAVVAGVVGETATEMMTVVEEVEDKLRDRPYFMTSPDLLEAMLTEAARRSAAVSQIFVYDAAGAPMGQGGDTARPPAAPTRIRPPERAGDMQFALLDPPADGRPATAALWTRVESQGKPLAVIGAALDAERLASRLAVIEAQAPAALDVLFQGRWVLARSPSAAAAAHQDPARRAEDAPARRLAPLPGLPFAAAAAPPLGPALERWREQAAAAAAAAAVSLAGFALLAMRARRAALGRAQALRRLALSEKRLEAIVDSSADGIVVYNDDGRIVEANAAFRRAFALPDSGPVTVAMTDLLVPADWRPGEPPLDRLKARSPQDCVASALDARIFHAEAATASFPTPEGQLNVSIIRDATDRKRAEFDRALRDRVFQSLSDGVVVMDEGQDDSPIIYVNAGFEQLTGWSGEEAVGQSLRFILAGGEHGAFETARRAVGVGRQTTATLHLRRRDGSTFLGELTALPLTDEFGDSRHWCAVIADVTDRRRAQEALEQAVEERTIELARRTEFLRLTLEHMGEGLAVFDAEGRLARWNGQFSAMLGLPFDAVAAGDRLHDVLRRAARAMGDDLTAADRRAAAMTDLIAAAGAGRTAAALPDGRAASFRRSVTPDGHMILLVGDETERLRAERDQRAAESRLALAMETMPSGLLLFSGDERLILWNARAGELLTPARGGADLATALDARDRLTLRAGDDLAAAFAAVGIESDPHKLSDLCAWCRSADLDGAERVQRLGARWLQIVARRTADGDLLLMIIDVTALKALQETQERHAQTLEQSLRAERRMRRMQRDFIATAQHEFRTPLAIIDGAARLMKRQVDAGAVDLDSARRKLQAMTEAVARITGLMEQTLAPDRLEAPAAPTAELQPLDPAALLRRAVERQSHLSPERRFQLSLDAAPPECVADQRLLDQAIDNLIGNAVKYSPAGGAIDVVCRRDGIDWEITVRDRGVGVPPADLPFVFDRFFRSESARGFPGAGIGLDLVKQCALAHGGSVAAANAPDGGASFTLRLPLAGAAARLDASQGD